MSPELAKRTVAGLHQAGVDFMAYLPESRLSEMLPLLREDPSFMLVPVASEADAASIAAGACLGGKRAAIYMEGTGLFVSAYNLMSVCERFAVPVLLLVSYIGSAADKRNSVAFAHYGQKILSLLGSLGFEYLIVKDGQDIEEQIGDAVRTMNSLKLPVALLFTGEFSL